MKPEHQRIAIAEHCGWRIENYGPMGYETLYWRLRTPDGEVVQQTAGCTGETWSRQMFGYLVPDYLNDLNSMQTAEKRLNDEQHREFRERLANTCEWIHPYRRDRHTVSDATPAHRAEALLKTLGLWADDISANVRDHQSPATGGSHDE